MPNQKTRSITSHLEINPLISHQMISTFTNELEYLKLCFLKVPISWGIKVSNIFSVADDKSLESSGEVFIYILAPFWVRTLLWKRRRDFLGLWKKSFPYFKQILMIFFFSYRTSLIFLVGASLLEDSWMRLLVRENLGGLSSTYYIKYKITRLSFEEQLNDKWVNW